MVDTRVYSPFPQEYWEELDETFREPIRTKTIGKLLMDATGPYGEGKSYATFRTFTDVPRGVISMRLDMNNRQMISPSESSLPIPYIHSEWTFSRRDMMALKNGEPFNRAVISSHAYAVALQEDYLTLDGWQADGTNYTINGLYNAAGNSTAGSSFGTQGGAVTSYGSAIALFAADNIFEDLNLVLNATQWGEVKSSYYSNAGTWEDEVVAKQMRGELFVSPAITAGTGLFLTKRGTGHFESVVGVGPTQIVDEIKLGNMAGEAGGVIGTIFECLAPRVIHSVALCKLTTI